MWYWMAGSGVLVEVLGEGGDEVGFIGRGDIVETAVTGGVRVEVETWGRRTLPEAGVDETWDGEVEKVLDEELGGKAVNISSGMRGWKRSGPRAWWEGGPCL